AVDRPSGMPADDIMEISTQAAELRGRSVAVVTSAEPLTEQQSDDLRARLATLYGREIAIHNDVDQALLGGVVVRVGDEIIDGSVAGRLDAMRRSLR
ncbi:MAG: ATP synthase F1 subunit delta, partial [Dietzia cercidiphylli]